MRLCTVLWQSVTSEEKKGLVQKYVASESHRKCWPVCQSIKNQMALYCFHLKITPLLNRWSTNFLHAGGHEWHPQMSCWWNTPPDFTISRSWASPFPSSIVLLSAIPCRPSFLGLGWMRLSRQRVDGMPPFPLGCGLGWEEGLHMLHRRGDTIAST